MLSGNKGEWSEVYVLLRLLGEGRLYAADENVARRDGVFFPILYILRERAWQNGPVRYHINRSERHIEVYVHDEQVATFDKAAFDAAADRLYEDMRSGGSTGAFTSERTEAFMHTIYTDKLKAPSADKKDIVMQVHDYHTGYNPVCGFSIKSELGASPTLLNSAATTNFIYEVKGLTTGDMARINAMEGRTKIKDRMTAVKEKGSLSFVQTSHPMLTQNLMLVDSWMPHIMAKALEYHYMENLSTCEDVVARLEAANPLGYPASGFYQVKFKNLLRAVALGMVPSKPWSGIDEANGGYIIVRSDGEVLAYYIYNKDSFETYLLRHTKFERGSTTRHQYASLYEKDNHIYINLNLAIRFTD